jgi:nucleotide-binding universal stress UspA family protein
MVDIRRILCPIDFSDGCRHALEHATVMAGWYGSHLTALHVVNPVFRIQPPIPFADFTGPVPADADREALREKLHVWLEPARRAGVETDALQDTGKPAARILECAASLPADLVVMGTHGRSGFERFLLGSVTENVLRKAMCPVLTVPPLTAPTSKLPFKQLLCPVDFSEQSISALQFAFSIAQESDARITILHVFEWTSDDQLLAKRAFELSEFRRGREIEARQQLDALISDEVRNWCAPEPMLRYGKPCRQILTVAEAEQFDLIVMGVQGRNALDVMLFGSTTNQVVRQAPCPVLTLRL